MTPWLSWAAFLAVVGAPYLVTVVIVALDRPTRSRRP